MCGISGYVGASVPEAIERMTAALAHRGPDGSGTCHNLPDQVHLGHRRLSILDHAGGAQPMTTGDGKELVVVFNGELFNAPELRRELQQRGRAFRSDHSDTEVLLHGYREWGRRLPDRLDGMWAFVIFDRRQRQLFGCRDRFGEKPLFYAETPSAFLFASELRALREHPAAPRSLSRPALRKYFAYGYIPSPLSLVEGVNKLPPGHSFVFDLATHRLTLQRYWQFVLEPGREPPDPLGTWSEELRALLDQAVRRRLVADVPVGVFLSGGIDSSAITAFAARHSAGGKLPTFAVGFTEPSFDESAHARRVASAFATDHHEERLTLDVARAVLPEIAARIDEPLGDPSLLPTYLLARLARRQVQVALAGDGGDELFAGYDPFRALRCAALYAKWTPRPVHHAIRLLAARLPVSHRNLSADFRVKRLLRGLAFPSRLWLPLWMAPLEPREIAELLREPADPEDLYSEAIAAWEESAQADLVDRTLQFFTRLYFAENILVKLDRATMLHGLEARLPFLDRDVVEFARKLPSRWKLRGDETKYLLRRALDPVLPREIVTRRKKGFGAPIGGWLREGALDIDIDALPAPLDRDIARRKLAAHRAGREDQRAFLWNAWLLAEWSKAGAQRHAS